MEGLLITTICLLSIVLVVLVIALVVYSRRIADSARELSQTLQAVREAVIPLADDTRQVLTNIDGLVKSVREQVDRIDAVVDSVERVIQGRAVTQVAGKAVAGSRITLVSAIEGLKQGLAVLRSVRKEQKEEPDNE